MPLWELAKEIGISTGSSHAISSQDLRMHQVSAKFVSRLLTEDQRIQRVPPATVPFNVINEDETCVYGYGVKNKMTVIVMEES
jgi:hypothetical protein